MDKAMRDFLVARDGAIADVIDHTPRAASFFIDPTGGYQRCCRTRKASPMPKST
jgi:hypothetical protein